MQLSKISVPGHRGTWYVISSMSAVCKITNKREKFYLLEHEKYGDEAASLIINSDMSMVFEDIFDGFQDEAFKDSLKNSSY